MLKCRSFECDDVDEIADNINTFLRSNPDIEVVSLSHSTFETNTKYGVCTALLIYKEVKR